MNTRTMGAIFKRDFMSYFGSPLGYVIILFFVLSTGAFAFGFESFFVSNRANLDLLSGYFPYLLVLIVPAMSMAAWAEEYKQGTEELLFTLPARDFEIVLAKYAACLGIYTVSLVFTFSHVVVLSFLGSPDAGLMLSTYLGYWLMGASMVAVCMLASALTRNLTVAFILGALGCAALVGLHHVGERIPGDLGALLAELGLVPRFQSFFRGAMTLEDLLYPLVVTGAALYGNAVMVSRRHWTEAGIRAAHRTLRLASIVVAGMSLVLIAERTAARVDVTAERLLSLSDEAKQVLDQIPAEQPVFVQAFVSPEVPADYLDVRDGLVRLLEEFDAEGGDMVRVAIHWTERYSEAATQAKDQFQIQARRVAATVDGRETSEEIFLGLAFTCGPREEVIPFFDKGLPIEYELTRAIGVVAQVERPKVGVLATGAKLFGGFDFQTMNRSRDWQIVQDLRRQYEVEQVDGVARIDSSLQALIVPMPSTLTQEKLDRLVEYLYDGGQALFLCDPFPMFSNLTLAPARPADGGRNPFQPNPGPPPEPKGDIEAFFKTLGVKWDKLQVVWDDHNPHPRYQELDREIVFVVDDSDGGLSGFNEDQAVSAGLQEVAMLWPGEVGAADEVQGISVSPLLQSRQQSGTLAWGDVTEESIFGVQFKPNPARAYVPLGEQRTLAVLAQGHVTPHKDGESMKAGTVSSREFKAIVVADCDMISDGLYQLRRQGDNEFDLDNVNFVANCIDWLAGEEDFIALRKRRRQHRPLSRLVEIEARLRKQENEAANQAGKNADDELAEAQKRLDDAVAAIEARADLDYRTKEVQTRYVQDREQRKLDAAKAGIENRKKEQVEAARAATQRELKLERARIMIMAVLLPPLPALLIGLFMAMRKVVREREGTQPARRRS
jgi:ABC-2 type transport system permease protein